MKREISYKNNCLKLKNNSNKFQEEEGEIVESENEEQEIENEDQEEGEVEDVGDVEDGEEDEEEEVVEEKEDEEDSDDDEEDDNENDDDDDEELLEKEVRGPKGSVIKVVPPKPRLASTVWTRLTRTPIKSEVKAVNNR